MILFVILKKRNILRTLSLCTAILLSAFCVYTHLPYGKTETADAQATGSEEKLVALTFDDGPHAEYTDRILDILERYGAVATFFEVGQNLHKAPDAVRRALALGCELGSHTYSHINMKSATAAEIREEIQKTNDAFYEITGTVPTLLRPPYGETNKGLLEISEQYLIGWSVDTLDWKYRDAAKIVQNLKNEGDLDGDVILMHSIYESTVKAVETIVPWLIENGYRLVTVSELMRCRVENPFQKGVYYGYVYFKRD